jgi:acyl-CoA thioester hydrolase
MTASMSYRGTVYAWHCDHVGDMSVMWYAAKFDEAS